MSLLLVPDRQDSDFDFFFPEFVSGQSPTEQSICVIATADFHNAILGKSIQRMHTPFIFLPYGTHIHAQDACCFTNYIIFATVGFGRWMPTRSSVFFTRN
jgi:hypothetical protein